MRKYLVTKFVCAKCGNNLQITYHMPKAAGNYEAGEPTGADMVAQKIAIMPCIKCAMPSNEMKKAVRTIIEIAQLSGIRD